MGDRWDEEYERNSQDLPRSPLRSPVGTVPRDNRRSGIRERNREHDTTIRDMERAVKQWQYEADELRQLLDDSADQLQSQKERSDRLEVQLRDSEARSIGHEVARQKSEMECSRLQDEVKRMKLQLEAALHEIRVAQANIDNADAERDKAEESAARARERERKLMQTIALRDAHDAGVREGRKEGYKDGLTRGRSEGKKEERSHAYKAFDDFLLRTWPDGIPDDMETPALHWTSGTKRQDEYDSPVDRNAEPVYAIPNRGRSPMRSPMRSPTRDAIPPPRPIPVNVQESGARAQQPQYMTPQDFPRSRRASIAVPLSPAPGLPPLPNVPDVAPMVAPMPIRSVATPMKAPQPMLVNPSSRVPSRGPSPFRDALGLSQPGLISPSHSRPHTPVADIPDGYVPVVRENEKISLPPPHEVQPTKGVLPQTQAEANKMGEMSYDFNRGSRAPSRATMRSAAGGGAQPNIVSPAPHMPIDPAQLFDQPGTTPSRAGSRAPSRGPSRAPSMALGQDDVFGGGYNRAASRPASVAQTARSGYGRSAADPEAIPLPASMDPSMGPGRSVWSQSRDVASPAQSQRPMQPFLGGNLSPPAGRAPSRGQSPHIPGIGETFYPPLPPEGGTNWGGSQTTRIPGSTRTYYPPLPMEGNTEYGSGSIR